MPSEPLDIPELSEMDGVWDPLLDHVKDGTVIPIVGPELYRTEDGRDYFETLAATLGRTNPFTEAASPPSDLATLFTRYLSPKHGGTRPRIYPMLNNLVERMSPGWKTPPAVRQLAEIHDFRLLVTTSFDPLLELAVNAVRTENEPPALSLAYAPRARVDLPEKVHPGRIVYHLFGRSAANEEFAVTEEDWLEFVHWLQASTWQPQLLFDRLRESNLLFLGTRFPDWLSRFLLRMTRGGRLSATSGDRNRLDYLINGSGPEQTNLVLFLRNCTREVEILGYEHPTLFVQELHRRWSERRRRNPQEKAAGETDNPRLERGDIFLSYASENRAVVEQMHRALTEAKLHVWFDRTALQGGQEWDEEIKRGIRNCSLFIPLISRESAGRPADAYVRKEWLWATSHRELLPQVDRSVFIYPCLIDDAPETRQEARRSFPSLQSVHLPEGKATPDLIDSLRRLVRDFKKREAAR